MKAEKQRQHKHGEDRKTPGLEDRNLILVVGGALIGLSLWLALGSTVTGSITKADIAQVTVAIINVVVLVGLLVITARYARSTHEMALAAKDEASATKKLVEQSVRPVLRVDVKLETLQDRKDLFIFLRWGNEGTGPALNIRCYVRLIHESGQQELVNKGRGRTGPEVLMFNDYLAVGHWISSPEYPLAFIPMWERYVTCNLGDVREVKAIAVYQDILGKYFQSESRASRVAGDEFQFQAGEFTATELTEEEAQHTLAGAGFSIRPA